jgi:glycosyltransferase involved in cell wall biosynthesis
VGIQRVTFVAPETITAGTVKGGAQTVGAQLHTQFVSLGWDVRVLCSRAWHDSTVPQAKFTDTLLDADIVMATDPTSCDESISASEAEQLVRDSDLVVVMDRWVGRVVSDGAVVLLLSNLAYANERLAAEQPGWDGIWVPSDYLAAQVQTALKGVSTDVAVVQPVILPHVCEGDCSIRVGRPGVRVRDLGRRRLLFPHRLDVGKGWLDAVDLLGLLAARDPGWTLLVTAGSGHDEPGKAELVGATFERITRFGLSENFKVVPWLPQPQMGCLYAAGDVTLIGSTLPEGFGLVLFESLAAGVPVVTTSSGNLGHAATRVDGVWNVERLASSAGVDAVNAAYTLGVDSATKDAVQQRYSWAAQRKSLGQALQTLRSAEK